MEIFNIVQPGPWFGAKHVPSTAVVAHHQSDMASTLLAICAHLKAGDFSAKPSLEAFILACTDNAIKQQAIRLYCYIAKHEDIAFLGNLLARYDHDEVETIAIYAPHTLSPQIVPYLFALLEDYEDTSIEEDILSSINRIYPFQYEGGKLDISALSERFSQFVNNISLEKYYYERQEAFAGNQPKNLIEAAALARQQGTPFPLTDVPTLLSIWSGEKCPIFYGDTVSSPDFEAVMGFVKHIASMQWVRGAKYFYGHLIS